jgi:hypothetical protein
MSRPDESTPAEQLPPPAETGERAAPVGSNARRRLLRGGLAAGPVILTIASRPVFGKVCTASTQGTLGGSVACTQPLVRGRLPGYWAATTSWPAPYVCGGSGSGATQGFAQVSPFGQSSTGGISQGTPYHSSTTGLTGTVFGTHTLLDVLQGNARGGTYKTLGKYIAAALLNAAAGKTPFLSQASVQKMWNDDLTLGYYEVTPGVRWTTNQIIAYLKTTMA